MQKSYRFSKNQEDIVLITVGGAYLKVKFDSSQKHAPVWGVKATPFCSPIKSTLDLGGYGC